MHYRIIGGISLDDETQLEGFNSMPQDKDDTILIEICSLGGDLDALMLYLNRIHEAKAAGKKIITWGSGPCCSAGATLLWQGHEVYVSPASLVMFHNSCETVIHGPLTMLWIKILDLWQAFKTGKKDDFSTFSDIIFQRLEPWDLILKSFGESAISGDYFMNAAEFASLKPEKVKVGIPSVKLKMFGSTDLEDEIDEEILQAAKDAIKDMKDAEDEDDEDDDNTVEETEEPK